jgi:hypothetical protein
MPPGRVCAQGAAWSPGTASLNFANYWNQVTPENGGKWGSVEGTRDVMNWTQADAAYALAKANGFKFKWHTFIWGNQQPAWIESLSTAEAGVRLVGFGRPDRSAEHGVHAQRILRRLVVDPDLQPTRTSDELRSVNGQIEYLLTDAVRRSGRRSPVPDDRRRDRDRPG